MSPDRFAIVNDVMLAEALRQLLPVAEAGVRALKTHRAAGPFRRAEIVLDLWVRQEPGRRKKLDGPLPQVPRFHDLLPPSTAYEEKDDDPGQTIPPECKRPPRPRRLRRKRPADILLMPAARVQDRTASTDVAAPGTRGEAADDHAILLFTMLVTRCAFCQEPLQSGEVCRCWHCSCGKTNRDREACSRCGAPLSAN